MKKIIMTIIVMSVLLGTLTGCGKTYKDDGKFQIVCTTFPIYDWVNNLVGGSSEDVEIILLLDNGVDMHSFQPGAKEIALVSSCDLLIYVGGESDKWIEDAIKESINKKQRTISLIEVLGEEAKEEDELEIPDDLGEGDLTDSDAEEQSANDSTKLDVEAKEIEYDEHVWLSLNNAIIFVETISTVLGEIDSANKTVYLENASKYIDKLKGLDDKYRNKILNSKSDTIIVTDRFPFRYLVDDYNIKYYAAFPGCSAETEASFEVVVYLSGKLDSVGITNVVVTESADKKIAETVIDNTKDKNQEIVTLHSMQAVTSEDYNSGITYCSIMEENLETLVNVLN